jgi:hypothetical protein
MIRWLVLLLATGCALIDPEYADCRAACEQVLAADGCAVPIPNPNVGEGTAIFACAQTCAGEEPAAQHAFVDCVATSTCEAILDDGCPGLEGFAN